MRALLVSWTYSGTIGTILVVIFLPLFVGLIWWAWSKNRKPVYDQLATMPLHDDSEK